MIIGVDLNDVLRDFTGRFEEIYNKYDMPGNVDLDANPMADFDLIKHFPFDGGVDEMNYFLFVEASLEIFGLGDEAIDHGFTKLNALNLDLIDEEEHKIVISSREANSSIPASYFFLSRHGCKIPKVTFHTHGEKLWEGVDVLITANPDALNAKPEGKISVKVNTTYNADIDADHSINDIIEFTDNEEVRNEILNLENTAK